MNECIEHAIRIYSILSIIVASLPEHRSIVSGFVTEATLSCIGVF